MAEKHRKKIYWIGGNLTRTERDTEWVPYGAQIEEHYRDMGGKDSGYDFEWVSRCTVKKFAEIWKDPQTYGIIWYSHGEAVSSHTFTGYPLAYSMYLDESWRGVPRGEAWEKMKLDPKKLPAPSPNLKFIAIKSCGSAELRDEWKQKAPNATVITHQGQLFRRESSRFRNFDQMMSWAKEGPGWISKGKVSEGAGYLFDLLPKEVSQSSGCDCNFGLREYWTKTQASAQQSGVRSVFHKRYFPGSGAVPANPLREIWNQGNVSPGFSSSQPKVPPFHQNAGGFTRHRRGGRRFGSASPGQRSGLDLSQRESGFGNHKSFEPPEFGSRPTWRPESNFPHQSTLRSIWNRGIGKPTHSQLSNPGVADNPLRQIWDQGNRLNRHHSTSFQNRSQNIRGQNPLRQMWDRGNQSR